MWIKRCIARSPMSALRPGICLGRRVWILLAMTHLTLDFSLCSPLSQGLGFKLISKPVSRPRPRLPPFWDTPNMLHWRRVSPLVRRILNTVPLMDSRGGPGPKVSGQRYRRLAHKGNPCQECQLKYTSTEVGDSAMAAAVVGLPAVSKTDMVRLLLRARRQLKWDGDSKSQDGRTTTVAGYIDWASTGPEDNFDYGEGKTATNPTIFTKALTTTVATTTTKSPLITFAVMTTPHPRTMSTTKSSVSLGETVKPPKPYGETPGLAVHQIITITVSLIMVIAALITTLVLKNCCAQSGNGRHSSHQRKIHQQEESCQNLTDFTPARVPSKVDIFTAYNDSLQCSHECVRTAVPIYTDEMIQQTPIYKTTYNGNRPSPTERQLIPVAFVSEKWFEISC
ncbi:hypothetical protein UPYG_G00008640 [Umbra pygmaea]|uniref:AJAP1/PANP C-terminal domain-containing protein n=1 Tax=Umbra pygmaea TaxID=75934 RepID=A0ABD0XL88_UMBPY